MTRAAKNPIHHGPGAWARWVLPSTIIIGVATLGILIHLAAKAALTDWGVALGLDAIVSAALAACLGWAAMALRRENTALRSAESALRESLDEQARMLTRERELARELDHRVRNNVAGLLGLVSLYERSGKDGREVAAAIRGKLHAMHEVHNIIARTHGQPVDLGGLVRRLSSELTQPDTHSAIEIAGPSVEVPASVAGPVAVILHELFTNARKHGALTASDGRIDISWDAPTNSRFELRWIESGGADRNGASKGMGVGLNLIKGFAESDLRGSFEHTLDSEGFRCRLRATIDPPAQGQK